MADEDWVEARTADLHAFFSSGETYLARLRDLGADVASTRSAAKGSISSPTPFPLALAAKGQAQYASNDPFAELVAEAEINNLYVKEVHDSLKEIPDVGGITKAPAEMVNSALDKVGLGDVSGDLSLEDDRALAERLRIADEVKQINIAEADEIVNSALEIEDPEDRFLAIQDAISGETDPEIIALVLADDRIPEIVSGAAQVVDDKFAEGWDYGSTYALTGGFTQLDILIRYGNPELSAMLLDETYDTIDRYVELVMEAEGSSAFIPIGVLQTTEFISDNVVMAEDGDAHVTRLAGIVNTIWPGEQFRQVYNSAGSNGAGVELYIEMARLRADAGDGTEEMVLDRAFFAAEQFVELEVNQSVDSYSDHTEEMNFYIGSFGSSMSPEELNAAIENYLANQDSDWHDRFLLRQRRVAEAGARFLIIQDRLNQLPPELMVIPHQNPEFNHRLEELASDDNVEVAVSAALSEIPEVLLEINVESALSFFDVPKYANKGYGLGTKIATTYIDVSVKTALSSAPDDAARLSILNDSLDNMRSSVWANALLIDGGLDELDAAIDLLQDAMANGSPEDLVAANELLDEALGELPGFKKNTPLGIAFRGIGLTFSILGAVGSTQKAWNDPSIVNLIDATVADLGLASSFVDIGVEFGGLADDGPWATVLGGNSSLSKVLGIVGIGLSVVGVFGNLSDGELVSAGFGAVGVGGSIYALAGSSAWAGPIGAAIAIAAAIGGLGWNQWKSTELSNRYTGADAREFLGFAGFSEAAANDLADRSGDGYSPVPAFLAYGEAQGWTLEQTIEWVNGLDGRDRDRIRNHFHRRLDGVNGDPSEIDNILYIPSSWYSNGDQALILDPSDWDVLKITGPYSTYDPVEGPATQARWAELGLDEINRRIEIIQNGDPADIALRADEVAHLQAGAELYEQYMSSNLAMADAPTAEQRYIGMGIHEIEKLILEWQDG